MKCRFSVIVPVYNAEITIKKCVESLLVANNNTAQLIIIDDGSTDNSRKICQELSAKASCISFIHQENQGVSAARNAGLKVACGDYITFVDSDDYVEPNYFDEIEKSLNDYDADLLLFGVKGKNNNFSPFSLTDPLDIAKKVDELEHKKLLASPCSKVFKRSIIEQFHLHFCPDLKIGEDMVFVYSYIMHIRSFSSIQTPLYNVITDNPESLSRKRRDYLCEQAILMRRTMLHDLKNANLPSAVYSAYYKTFGWSFYHSAYSVCKELLKYDIPRRIRIKKIIEVCRVFTQENITPVGLKSKIIALPVQLHAARTIDIVINFVEWRRKK